MATWKHTTRGTVVTTTADPGAGWERVGSPSVPDKTPEAPASAKKAAPKKAAAPKKTPAPKE